MDAELTLRNSSQDITEANHRIANSLTLLIGMVRLQARAVAKRSEPFSNAEFRLMLEGVAARIGTIAKLHRLLAHIPGDGTTTLRPHLCEITDTLVAALSSSEQSVTVKHSGDDCVMPVRHIQPIVLILCEIFINALKYAHPSGIALVVTVDCARGGDGRLALTISDDGVGLPEGFDAGKSQGLGFKVIRSLAGEIGARLEIISSGLGLVFRLSLPAGATANARLA